MRRLSMTPEDPERPLVTASEEHGLRLLARLLVRAYLKDREAGSMPGPSVPGVAEQ